MIRKLPRSFVNKVWGVERLPAPFPHPAEGKIGEVWFEPPPELSQLLVKYIFASERLSVQCHPNDRQAEAMGLGKCGKSECWVILDAEPGATIAVGFHEEITSEQMRRAAVDGSIVDMLEWHEVRAGDAFYIPAGTVHAIGGGVSLIEVQQNSDVTFRLFDYGRQRELHLDRSVEVALTRAYPKSHRSEIDGDQGVLIGSPHFDLRFWRAGSLAPFPMLHKGPALVIPFSGEFDVEGEKLVPGECAIHTRLSADAISGNGVLLIATPVDEG